MGVPVDQGALSLAAGDSDPDAACCNERLWASLFSVELLYAACTLAAG
jgi:hypothetical protein